ncbi:MAG: flippase-like domain-containing protein [Tissierellales bacterium]|jgi:uncharacterized protein (TIRG00374 family)|nr:flippase-like domain-containing protein [Tissierellales bacterium]
MKNNKWGILFVVGVIAAFSFYLVSTGKINTVMEHMGSINKNWLLAALGASITYWILEAKMVNNMIRSMGGHQTYFEAFKITIIGQFFSGITPFASGGQPMQLYLLTKQKVPVGKGSSALMSKFIIYQGTLVVYALILLLFKSSFFIENISNLFFLVILGFGVNAVVIGTLIFFSHSKRTNKGIAKKVIGFGHRIHLIKNPEKTIAGFNKHVEEFHDNVVLLKQNKLLFLNTVVLTVIQLTMFFIVPYFIYRSFGLSGANLMNMLSATAFVLMITSFIPIPGGTGGAEGGFHMMLGLFFIGNYALTAMVLWRLITYYLWILFGGIWMMMTDFSHKELAS